MKFPILGLDRTVIGAVTRITRVETNAIILFVIEESRYLRFDIGLVFFFYFLFYLFIQKTKKRERRDKRGSKSVHREVLSSVNVLWHLYSTEGTSFFLFTQNILHSPALIEYQ